MKILIGTPFIDRFVRGKFPAERKVMPWPSPPVTILENNEQKQMTPNTQNVYNANQNDEHISETEDISCASAARKVVSKPNMLQQVLVTTISSALITIEHHYLWSS